jgi:hypothetical protein
VILALGGESDELEAWPVAPAARAGDHVEFQVPPETWARMRPNLGWWWTVLGFAGHDPSIALRSTEVRCVIRHRALPRIPESGLRYPGETAATAVDLGGARPPDRDPLPLEPWKGPYPWARRGRHRKNGRPAGR